MQGFALSTESTHVVRIDPGEDVLEAVTEYCGSNDIRQAAVISGFGTLAAWSLHWVVHNRIPSENRFASGEGGIELLAVQGLVVDGKPHLHATLATEAGAFGGHVEPGCKAYVLCVVCLQELTGEPLSWGPGRRQLFPGWAKARSLNSAGPDCRGYTPALDRRCTQCISVCVS